MSWKQFFSPVLSMGVNQAGSRKTVGTFVQVKATAWTNWNMWPVKIPVARV